MLQNGRQVLCTTPWTLTLQNAQKLNLTKSLNSKCAWRAEVNQHYEMTNFLKFQSSDFGHIIHSAAAYYCDEVW